MPSSSSSASTKLDNSLVRKNHTKNRRDNSLVPKNHTSLRRDTNKTSAAKKTRKSDLDEQRLSCGKRCRQRWCGERSGAFDAEDEEEYLTITMEEEGSIIEDDGVMIEGGGGGIQGGKIVLGGRQKYGVVLISVEWRGKATSMRKLL